MGRKGTSCFEGQGERSGTTLEGEYLSRALFLDNFFQVIYGAIRF